LSLGSKQQSLEELKSEFLTEFRHMQGAVHRLIDHVTTIRVMRSLPAYTRKIIRQSNSQKSSATAEICTVTLRNCLRAHHEN
jgi:hypothetical protein